MHRWVLWAYTDAGFGFGSGSDRIATGRRAVHARMPSLGTLGPLVGAACDANPELRPGTGARDYVHDLARYYAIPAAERTTAMRHLADPWRKEVLGGGPTMRDVRTWHVVLAVFLAILGFATIQVPAIGLGFVLVVGIVILFGASAFTLLYFLRGS